MRAAALREHAGAIAPRNVEDRRDGESPATNKGEHMTGRINAIWQTMTWSLRVCANLESVGKGDPLKTWARKSGDVRRVYGCELTIETEDQTNLVK
jgi:hypothetical protein